MAKQLKVGDVVTVRKDLVIGKKYGMDSVVTGMESMCGKTTIIERVNISGYKIKGNSWNFTDEMFVEISKEKNLVYVNIHGGEKNYIFEVPANVTLYRYETVFVNTRFGETYGECVTNSFKMTNDALDAMVVGMGLQGKKLQMVTGKAIPQSSFKKEQF